VCWPSVLTVSEADHELQSPRLTGCASVLVVGSAWSSTATDWIGDVPTVAEPVTINGAGSEANVTVTPSG